MALGRRPIPAQGVGESETDLENLKAAVDHGWVNVRFECGTRKFEQDDKRKHLVNVQLWVGDKRLKDVIANRSFLYESEVGPVCDEIDVCVEAVGVSVSAVPRDYQVIVGELSQQTCTKVVL